MSVTRKRLRDGFYERMVAKAGLDRVRSKDERDASRRAILRALATLKARLISHSKVNHIRWMALVQPSVGQVLS